MSFVSGTPPFQKMTVSTWHAGETSQDNLIPVEDIFLSREKVPGISSRYQVPGTRCQVPGICSRYQVPIPAKMLRRLFCRVLHSLFPEESREDGRVLPVKCEPTSVYQTCKLSLLPKIIRTMQLFFHYLDTLCVAM